MFLDLIIQLIILIPSAIFHEYAHGWMADIQGDHTARYAGRLTLNPVAHFDLWGTLLLPIMLYLTTGMIFGYPKPVPVNPYNLRNQRWGSALVAAVGPLSNLLLALSLGLLVRFMGSSGISSILSYIVLVNVSLAIFNLLPVPPLDGSKILYALLPSSTYQIQRLFDRYGLIVILLFLFALSSFISPIIFYVYRLIILG